MAETKVKSPTGEIITVTHPEGASSEDILNFAKTQSEKQNVPVSAPKIEPPKERTFMDNVVGGAGKLAQGATFGYADELRALIRSELPSIFGDKTYDEHLAEARGVLDDFGQANPKTAFGLELAGGAVTGGAGASKVMAMKALQNAPKLAKFAGIGAGQGALAGSGYATEGERLKGAGIGAGLGAGLGAAIPTAVGALSRAILPKSNIGGAAKKLIDAGITLTPGQRMGGVVQTFEDSAGNIPGLGRVINAAQQRGITDLNRVAINRALEPIGEKLSKKTPIGRTAIDEMIRKISNKYETLLPKIRLQADDKFAEELSTLMDNGLYLSKETAPKLKKLIDDQIFKNIDAKASIPGETFKKVESKLTKLVKDYSRKGGDDAELAGAIRELRAILRRGLERSVSGDEATQLASVNQAYRLSKIVGKAGQMSSTAGRTANDEISGVFTPANLNTAVRAADPSKDKTAYARGAATMQDLSDIAMQRLPQTLNDSGTAPRLLHALLLSGVGGSQINPLTGLGLGLAAGAYTRPGQRLISSLLNRPQGAGRLSENLTNLNAPGISAANIYSGRR